MPRMSDVSAQIETLKHEMVELVRVQRETSTMFAEFIEESRAAREASAVEMGALREEVRTSREASAAEMDAFRETSAANMDAFREEMRASREASARELAEFKDESRRDRKALHREWGRLANRFGWLVEGIVYPNVVGIGRRYFGYKDPIWYARNVGRRHVPTQGDNYEIDVIAVYPEAVVVAEARTTVRTGAAGDFRKKLSRFPEVFPEYKELRLIPIMCAIDMPESIVAELTAERIYAMVSGDETMVIVNADEIR